MGINRNLYNRPRGEDNNPSSASGGLKVKSVSNEQLNLAQQPVRANDNAANGPDPSGPVYDDQELVRRAQNDDPWAIEQLVLRYQKKVYAIAFQMLAGDAEEAQDRTQDAFLQAFRKIKQFKGKSTFYTWLYRIVINTCLDARRRRRRWKKVFFPWRFEKNNDALTETSLEEYPDTNSNSDPLATASRRQLEDDVNSALSKLSERQRTIFQLKVFQEMSIAEIAESMGLAQGTIKTHLFRATRVVQKQLKSWARA
jgi:RNA polymerase sigma-70 factor (ECF subfamily)